MSFTLESHLEPAHARDALARDVLHGLTAVPKRLPPTWLYDEHGSRLFDRITTLPEYYPTRAEKRLLRRHATELATVSGADTLVELGSGTSEKTRVLLAALLDAGTLHRYVAVDVDPTVLTTAGTTLAEELPHIDVRGVVADFEHHLHLLPRDGHRMLAFLGSTIGNLEPGPRAAFLTTVRAGLDVGETFLLGTDLVKDPARLVAAYDDADGVTAEFNRNVLRVVNRELDADLHPEAFDHVAVWDPEHEWVEMRLRARNGLRARVGALDLDVQFASGEELRTEVSAKFTRARVERELAAAGLGLLRWWSDGDVALSLSTPV
jgi:L-histidine N-alpha-methyltransferase